jgi:hypothetical protein
MKPYILREKITLGGGDIVGLSKQQSGPRKSYLKEIAPDVFSVTDVIEFKKGEKLLFDSPPKRLRAVLAEPGKEDEPPVDLADENELLRFELEELKSESEVKLRSKDDIIVSLQKRVEELEAEIEKSKPKKKK